MLNTIRFVGLAQRLESAKESFNESSQALGDTGACFLVNNLYCLRHRDSRWCLELFLGSSFFGVVNTFLGGLLKLFTLPAVILTFGLFVFVINAAMLTLVDRWSDVLTFDKFTSALMGAFIISLISGFTNKLVNKA